MEGIGIIGNCMTFVMSFSDTHQQRVLCYLCFGFFVLVLCVSADSKGRNKAVIDIQNWDMCGLLL